MEKLALSAEKRTLQGKKTKQLRKQGIMPAVVYAPGEESHDVQLSRIEFEKVFKKAGHSVLVDITVDGTKSKVLIQEVQYDPRTRSLLHAMFNKVNLKEEMTAEVPVELIGEAPAVKIEKAVLVTPIDAIEVKCLPSDLPSKIEVDISKLQSIGDSITIADVKLPEGVKLVHEDDIEKVLVSATAPQKEEEVETTEAPSPEDVELSVKKGKDEAAE